VEWYHASAVQQKQQGQTQRNPSTKSYSIISSTSGFFQNVENSNSKAVVEIDMDKSNIFHTSLLSCGGDFATKSYTVVSIK